MREKVNEHFIASKHGIDPDEIDILTNNSELVHGSTEDYDDLISYIKYNNLSPDANYKYVEDRVDIDNYIIYQVSQIYFNNHDWPGNNIKYWKHKEGKWRWIIYDTDFGFGSHPSWLGYNYNTLNFALNENGPNWPNPPWSTLLFRRLVENLEFRNKFINRYSDELNSRFLPERFSNHIDSMIDKIKIEIPSHFDRWRNYVQNWNYEDYVNDMKNFSNNRSFFCREHIKSTFNLPSIQNLSLSIEDNEMGYIELNDNLKINSSDWTGKYFESVPVKIYAQSNPGFSFSHWSDESLTQYENLDLNSPTLEVDLKDFSKFKAHFDVAPLSTENTIFINKIYPNPADNLLKISLKPGLDIKSVHFIDMKGEVFKPLSVIRTRYSLDVNVSNFDNGIYILELQSENEVSRVKVVIEKRN